MGRGSGGPRAEIFGVHDGDRHALEGKVAKRGNAVDAGTDDQHIDTGVVPEAPETIRTTRGGIFCHNLSCRQ